MIDDGMDTGKIMFREQCLIGPDETVGEVHDKLMAMGSDLVVQTVEAIIENNVDLRIQGSFVQGSEILRPAPKLSRELCHIDWNGKTRHIYNLIRGLSPYPAAFTEIVKGDKVQQMKIYKAVKVTGEDYAAMMTSCGIETAAPGTVLSDGKNFIAFATADGAISVTELQLAGKKRMPVKEFLIGFREPMAYTTTEGTSSKITGKHA
jgi:methionyl-tRNA formyltransferase